MVLLFTFALALIFDLLTIHSITDLYTVFEGSCALFIHGSVFIVTSPSSFPLPAVMAASYHQLAIRVLRDPSTLFHMFLVIHIGT